MNSHDALNAAPDAVPSSSPFTGGPAPEISSSDVKVEMALPATPTHPSIHHKVAANYFKAVTVIDDEIYKKGRFETGEEGQMLIKRFDSLRQSCEERGMLCHLLQFPHTVGDATDYGDPETRKHLDRAVASAKAADVVVLDWNLGHETHHGNALHILKALAESSHVGFVMIYTQQKSLKSVSIDLQTAFNRWGNNLEPLLLEEDPKPDSTDADANDFEEGEVAEPKQFGFQLNQRLFVFLSVKDQDDRVGVRAEDLVDVIYNALESSLQGRLKWAGLELMARFREVLPQVVAALPDADPALLGQILFQKQDEVAAQVADSLLDELRHALAEKPLEVVGDQELFAALKEHMIALCSDLERWGKVVGQKTYTATKTSKVRVESRKNVQPHEKEPWGRFETLADNWQNAELDALRDEITQGEEEGPEKNSPLSGLTVYIKGGLVPTLAHYLVETAEESEALKTHIAWAQVRESVLLSQNLTLRPGTVLKKIKGPETAPEWLFCQTGACDCYRPTGYGFTFIVGAAPKKSRSGRSETQACVSGHEIVWNAAHMHILQDPTEEKQLESGKGHSDCGVEQATYEIVGALRFEFAARTIQRVFNHQGRIGVDTCEWIRMRRGE